MTRKLVGVVLFLFAMAILFADFHVAYLKQSAAHMLNVLAGIASLFAGLLALMPTFAREIADEIAKRAPVLMSRWPGGQRVDDPPAQPGVPPPPSVTKPNDADERGED